MWHIPLIWFLVGLALVASEFIVPGFVIFFFGVGAMLTGVLSAFIPGLDTNIFMQTIIWMSSSLISLFSMRKYLSKIFKGRFFGEKEGLEASGKVAVVTEEITPDKAGRVKFEGTSWKAISYTETLKSGEEVEILKKENLTFIVTKSIIDKITD